MYLTLLVAVVFSIMKSVIRISTRAASRAKLKLMVVIFPLSFPTSHVRIIDSAYLAIVRICAALQSCGDSVFFINKPGMGERSTGLAG